ncbi:uncharacterized protein LOC117643918 [Thrips palmi]|uniref:Uncharacterized protein LOC117643918 n=1 Tax=Thrips palmi TaxID=161013 RepID=A0A6P8YP36_THRPL|nr:uncharacterized protein LOC117643918 [Thrips palmi]
MRASSKFHEEHLKREALNVLTIVASPECQRHLAMVARGEIQKNETQAGLGPFNLFKDLQTTLLDCLESYEVGANMKYNVLLPEAIIFSLMKIHNYSWEEAKTNFIEYSAIVEPCLESQE